MAAVPNSPSVSVDEYLSTAYDPDVEFVDGVLVERNVGDWLHSLVQWNVLQFLRQKFPHLKVVPELRSRVSETRFRLPDVTAVLRAPGTDYLADPAYLVVEVLSKRDEMSEVMQKLYEYHRKGVSNIWLVDPRRKSMFAYRHPVLEEVVDGDRLVTSDNAVWLSGAEIFAE